MKEIDRRGRTLNRVIMWGIWLLIHALFATVFLAVPTEDDMTVPYVQFALVSAFFSFGVVYGGYYTVPRAYFSEEGVYIKRFILKRFYPWSDIEEACILKQRTPTRLGRVRSTYYQFYLLTSKGSLWKPGDTEKTYRWRNRRYLLPIPLTDESKEYVKLHHVKLAVDQSKGKEILWRLVK